MSRQLLIRLTLSTAAAGLFMYLAFRNVRPNADRLWASMRAIELRWLLVYLVVTVAAQTARTVRWGVLLKPLGGGIPLRRLIPVSVVGYMATFFLPAVGEMVRPYLIRDRDGVRGTAALATIVVERIFDGLLVAFAAFVALYPIRSRPGAPLWVDAVCFGTLSVFVSALTVIILLRWQRDRTLAVARRVFQPISVRLSDLVVSRLESFVDGLAALPNRSVTFKAIALTLVYWFFNGLALQVLARSFGIFLDLQATWATIGVIVLGFFIPVPGQVGTYHHFCALGLGLFLSRHVMEGPGAALVITMHALQVTIFGLAGSIAMFSPEVRLWRRAATGAVVALAILLVPLSAQAKSARTYAAARESAWNAAVRFIRVDRGYVIRDKDKDAGFVLFDWAQDGKKYPASLELTGAPDVKSEVRVQVRCDDLPSYEEVHFLDRLGEKIKQEGQDGPKSPPPPPPPATK